MDGWIGYGNLCVGLFYEHRFAVQIKVPIPYNHVYFCFTKRTLEEEKYTIFRFDTIIHIMWTLPSDG